MKPQIGDDVWMIVKHVKPKKLHPDAIAIEGRYDLSYAEMPRKVKGDSTLNGLGGNVPGIRRTQKGELLLEFRKT